LSHALIRVGDGEEAITYLSGKPPPALAILDLRMPKLDGFDVLEFMRAQPTLRDLPVIILSGSDHPRDRARAAQLGVRDYLLKTPKWDTVVTALKTHLAALGM
jgi:CheY-like chemotaxis protein